MPEEIKGHIIFALSEEDGLFHIVYDELAAQRKGYNILAAALFDVMRKCPGLVEEILQAALKASEDLCQPFNDILNERPSEN